MQTSEQGKEARERDNNVTVWYYASVRPRLISHCTRTRRPGLIKQVASHLSYLSPDTSTVQAYQFFKILIQRHSGPESFLKNELKRTRPRHYTLFTLEPTFILAALTARSGYSPPSDILDFLRTLLAFAKGVQPGEIER
jgi:hypothetical protein